MQRQDVASKISKMHTVAFRIVVWKPFKSYTLAALPEGSESMFRAIAHRNCSKTLRDQLKELKRLSSICSELTFCCAACYN